jgi:hypothetical protein
VFCGTVVGVRVGVRVAVGGVPVALGGWGILVRVARGPTV